MELLILVILSALAIPFADLADMSPTKLNIFGAIGGALKKIGQAAMPAAMGFLTGGPAGAVAGAASSFLGGGGEQPQGTLGKIAQAAQIAIPAIEAFRNRRQSDRDTSRARELTNQSVGLANRGAEIAQQSFLANAPLREAFRSGALGFVDPTNPLSGAISQAAPQSQGLPPEISDTLGGIAQMVAQSMGSGRRTDSDQSGGSKPTGPQAKKPKQASTQRTTSRTRTDTDGETA